MKNDYIDDKLRIYFDTEFTGLHQEAQLISIGCVSDSGTQFYAEFGNFDPTELDEWVQKNVIAHLMLGSITDNSGLYWKKILKNIEPAGLYDVEICTKDSKMISHELKEWLSNESFRSKKQVQLYSDCLTYDWMLFNDLICWNALAIPDFINYIPIDLSTYLWAGGFDPDISREKFAGEIDVPGLMMGNRYKTPIPMKHNALWDAAVIQACFHRLQRHIIPNSDTTVITRKDYLK